MLFEDSHCVLQDERVISVSWVEVDQGRDGWYRSPDW
jgi:hypothetical protein